MKRHPLPASLARSIFGSWMYCTIRTWTTINARGPFHNRRNLNSISQWNAYRREMYRSGFTIISRWAIQWSSPVLVATLACFWMVSIWMTSQIRTNSSFWLEVRFCVICFWHSAFRMSKEFCYLCAWVKRNRGQFLTCPQQSPVCFSRKRSLLVASRPLCQQRGMVTEHVCATNTPFTQST